MKILCAFGQHNYGDPNRGEGYEYSNFIPTLRGLGHEVIHFETWRRDKYSDFAELNLEFLKTVERENPELIFCVLMQYELWLETLELVRRACPAIMVNWSTDDSWKYAQFSRFVAPVFHLYATTASEALQESREEGLSNFFLTQWAAGDKNLYAPLPSAQCRYQVSFVGSAYGNRTRWIAELGKRGIEVACFGHGWPHGAVSADDVTRIIRESAISLNFGDSEIMLNGLIPRRSRQLKARVFEVPGAGGFLLTEQADHLDDYYRPGREVAVFEGIDDLAQKIRHFLANPQERDEIAQAGHVRTRREHTYASRFQLLFKQIAMSENKKELDVRRKVSDCRIDFSRFNDCTTAHRIGLAHRLFRQFLFVIGAVLFGRKKGYRAVRRLVFEISWRVAGARTYCASGLPGRLFYKES